MKKQVKSSLEDFLVFDPTDPKSVELYAPGADWRIASQYPPIKPLGEYTQDDYLRLAWEILRRMPRYRRQRRKVLELGINNASFSKNQNHTYYTDNKLPNFEGWQDMLLRGHKCMPPISHQGETFGEYVEARGDYEEWFVMSRHKWILDLWGLSYLEDPATSFQNQKKGGIFQRPILIFEDHVLGLPRLVTTFVKQNEVVFRMRIDSPLDLQIEALKSEFHNARKKAALEQRDPFAPLGLPRNKMPKKVFALSTVDNNLAESSGVPDFNERGGRVLLKQLEFSPMWLRVWDAVQDARVVKMGEFSIRERKNRWPSLDRKELIAKFDADYLSLNSPNLKTNFEKSKINKTSGLGETTLRDALQRTLASDPIDNWRKRVEKYIEGGDDAYRQLVAVAFTKATAVRLSQPPTLNRG